MTNGRARCQVLQVELKDEPFKDTDGPTSAYRSLQSTSQKVLVYFDVIVRVAVIGDASLFLLLDILGQLEVHTSDVFRHSATFRSGIVPGTLERFRGQVHPFVASQLKIVAE